MLTVHHLGISQSDRIVWLCEELQLPYELVLHQRDPVTRLAPAGYKDLHPLGTAPVIVDGDLVLAESGAIIEYIIAKYAPGQLMLPATHPGFAQYLYWFHFANGTLMPAMMGSMGEGGFAGFMQGRVGTALATLDARLAGSTWLAGDDFTVADIIMAFPLTTMREFVPIDLKPYPNILAYLQRIGARPAFARAMAKAEPGRTIKLD